MRIPYWLGCVIMAFIAAASVGSIIYWALQPIEIVVDRITIY